jgi:hypothetical protein
MKVWAMDKDCHLGLAASRQRARKQSERKFSSRFTSFIILIEIRLCGASHAFVLLDRLRVPCIVSKRIFLINFPCIAITTWTSISARIKVRYFHRQTALRTWIFSHQFFTCALYGHSNSHSSDPALPQFPCLSNAQSRYSSSSISSGSSSSSSSYIDLPLSIWPGSKSSRSFKRPAPRPFPQAQGKI